MGSAEPTLRSGSFDTLDPHAAYAIWTLRSEVFVVEQDCPYLDLDGRDTDPTTTHVWLEDDGRVIGYLRLLDEGDALRIARVVVAADRRGGGLAEQLMLAALDLVGTRPSYLHAQSQLERWYERFGYARSGDDYVEDGIPHTPMARR